MVSEFALPLIRSQRTIFVNFVANNVVYVQVGLEGFRHGGMCFGWGLEGEKEDLELQEIGGRLRSRRKES